ncbi:hypothetical protein Tco_1062647 [Tanacetum coccineum]
MIIKGMFFFKFSTKDEMESILENGPCDRDVEVAYDKTAQFMASGGANDNKKQNAVYGKVLRPNFKPNTKLYRGGNQRGNMNGKGEPKFTFQHKKKVNENVVPKEPDIIPKTTTTMRRSANKLSVFEKYDENETNNLQSVMNREAVEKFISQKIDPSASIMKKWNEDMVTYYRKRIAEFSEKGVTSGRTKEVNDVFPDVSGMARCVEEDGMNGMGDGILNEC